MSPHNSDGSPDEKIRCALESKEGREALGQALSELIEKELWIRRNMTPMECMAEFVKEQNKK